MSDTNPIDVGSTKAGEVEEAGTLLIIVLKAETGQRGDRGIKVYGIMTLRCENWLVFDQVKVSKREPVLLKEKEPLEIWREMSKEVTEGGTTLDFRKNPKKPIRKVC